MNPGHIDTHLTRAQARIEESFATMGGITIYLSEEEIAADEWRKLMRMVARELGRPVETFANETTVVGALKDWPATAEEQRKAKNNQRRAIQALNDPLRTFRRIMPSACWSSLLIRREASSRQAFPRPPHLLRWQPYTQCRAPTILDLNIDSTIEL